LEKRLNKKNNKSLAILKMQITKSLSMHQNLSNVIVAYEPIWSIGTGVVADQAYLNKF
jgi:Triosephosphate isomerase